MNGLPHVKQEASLLFNGCLYSEASKRTVWQRYRIRPLCFTSYGLAQGTHLRVSIIAPGGRVS